MVIVGLTMLEMVGNGIGFFTAGFETTATTFTYLLYFLATNQDVQEKLHQEVTGILGDKVRFMYTSIQMRSINVSKAITLHCRHESALQL